MKIEDKLKDIERKILILIEYIIGISLGFAFIGIFLLFTIDILFFSILMKIILLELFLLIVIGILLTGAIICSVMKKK